MPFESAESTNGQGPTFRLASPSEFLKVPRAARATSSP
jgi:hypothetical protein